MSVKKRRKLRIYGGSGSAGMGVGHSWGFLLICSPCILEISSIFGYSGGLNKNCSPCPIHVWVQMTLFEEMFSFLIEIHGEQSGANGHLYPNSRRYSLDHGEQILLICFLCPNAENPRGTILKTQLLCPNTSCLAAGTTIIETGRTPGREVSQ